MALSALKIIPFVIILDFKPKISTYFIFKNLESNLDLVDEIKSLEYFIWKKFINKEKIYFAKNTPKTIKNNFGTSSKYFENIEYKRLKYSLFKFKISTF